jgi:hypothetical protein
MMIKRINIMIFKKEFILNISFKILHSFKFGLFPSKIKTLFEFILFKKNNEY